MINIQEIEEEIARLEQGNTTYSACEKLSILYAVRNELKPGIEPIQAYSLASEPKSEFLSAIENKDIDKVFDIIDEHMEVIKLLYPKEYNKILQLIYEIK